MPHYLDFSDQLPRFVGGLKDIFEQLYSYHGLSGLLACPNNFSEAAYANFSFNYVVLLNCGPYLVTKNEIKDINNLNLSLSVNDEMRQNGNTSRMIFNFNFLIHHISQFMVLYPGTIITTGTPAGTAMEMEKPKFLNDGDKVHIKIDSLGEQIHKIINE